MRSIQEAACSGQPSLKPRWAVILFRSPKGMTGVKELDGEPIENTYRAHQVPVPDPQTNPEHFRALEGWLSSYHVTEFFDENGSPKPEILEQCPKGNRRMGSNPHTYGGRIRKDLDLPDIFEFAVPAEDVAEKINGSSKNNFVSSPDQLARILTQILRPNPPPF